MIEPLYEAMVLPESCRLGMRVFKKQFHEYGNLSASDKKAFADDVDTIVWQYALKPSTISIMPYEDDQREYLEIAILQVNLKRTNRVNRLSEVIQRAIPYPVILIFVAEAAFSISLAYKRFSQTENDAIVAEAFQTTGWLDMSHQNDYESAFLCSLDITTWPHTHFYAFYRAAMDRVVALACAEHSGCYELPVANGSSTRVRSEQLKKIENLLQEKAELKRRLKREKNLGTQVQLNTQVKKITDCINAIKCGL